HMHRRTCFPKHLVTKKNLLHENVRTNNPHDIHGAVHGFLSFFPRALLRSKCFCGKLLDKGGQTAPGRNSGQANTSWAIRRARQNATPYRRARVRMYPSRRCNAAMNRSSFSFGVVGWPFRIPCFTITAWTFGWLTLSSL